MTILRNIPLSVWTLHQLQMMCQKTKVKRELLIPTLLNEYMCGSAYVHKWDEELECYVQCNLQPYVLPKVPKGEHKQVKFFVDGSLWQDLATEGKNRGQNLPAFIDRVLYLVASDHNNPRPLTELDNIK